MKETNYDGKKLAAGTVLTSGIGLNMFSDDELEKIHLATLEILWEMGVKVESSQALEILMELAVLLIIKQE